jgi:hypothetical protein
VSLVPETALAIASIPQYSRRPKGDLIVVELDLTPDHVQMVGHVPEKELIIDYGIGYDPTAIEPIISPVRFSLKDFDRNDLPKGDARKRSVYTLPAGTKLYHGSNKDTAAEIKKAGHVLLAEPHTNRVVEILLKGILFGLAIKKLQTDTQKVKQKAVRHEIKKNPEKFLRPSLTSQ